MTAASLDTVPPPADDAVLAILQGRTPSEPPRAPHALDVVAWSDLFAGVNHEEAIVDGLVLAGRWLALAAPAKQGKSTVALTVAVALATGSDPFTGGRRDPINVLYLDAEMGRVDVLDRLRDDHNLGPDDLTHLHYTDLVPYLNKPDGAGQVLGYVLANEITVVIVDGINGAVVGPEKDDETWRPLYDLTISALKRQGVAVVTCDNLGKDKTLGPRGSSVKVDKPDAVVLLERTDSGIRLKTTHRRTAAYPLTTELTAHGLEDDQPIHFRYSTSAWPAGTAAKAAELDTANVPLDTSTRAAREALKAAGLTAGKNDVLTAALRYRRSTDYTTRNLIAPPGNTTGNTPTDQNGKQ